MFTSHFPELYQPPPPRFHQLPQAENAAFIPGNIEFGPADKQLLSDLQDLTKDPEKYSIYWLDGIFGASAIAQSFSEWCHKEDLLGASFFCARNFQDRSDLQLLFPTLANQLALRYPEFRAALVSVISSPSKIQDMALSEQLLKVLIEPLKSTKLSIVLVINALDECLHEDPLSTILSLFAKLEDPPGMKIFVTGQQQQHSTTGFYRRHLRTYNGPLSVYKVLEVPPVLDFSEAEIDTMMFIPSVCSVHRALVMELKRMIRTQAERCHPFLGASRQWRLKNPLKFHIMKKSRAL